MFKKIKKSVNFLELVPQKNNTFKWEVDDEGLVQIIIPRNGVLDRIVRVFFKTPEVMRIDLDPIGSCVWKAIDGQRNIQDIANILKEEFGDKAEPLYERLGTYMNILRNNKFITLEKR
ncbi:PqqD family protein [Caloranaerobacter azorensis]|uniref:PqqD family protein n=1 Tax=Caloranaerobacter azorensis TaxID=116090 RepID=A0A6P1YGY0_9FIRM|nr:PqqD family protein [Caloranaerobacter azorensis]QIB27968.1 PqqD family protein [Caloranaerobacter azorensis]